jgi:hypothetical protein
MLLQDFKAHTKNLIGNLRQDYAEGVRTIKDMMGEQKHGMCREKRMKISRVLTNTPLSTVPQTTPCA